MAGISATMDYAAYEGHYSHAGVLGLVLPFPLFPVSSARQSSAGLYLA